MGLRLVDVDPDEVGRMVEFRLRELASTLAERLGLGELPRRGESSPIAAEARTLSRYAAEGPPKGSGGREGARAMREACGRLTALLWARAVEQTAPMEAINGPDGDLSDAVVLVLVAAWSRAELALGRGLTAKQLGALAGVDGRSVRRFGTQLALRPDERGRLVAAPERALAWLRARGVRGLPKER